MMWLKVSIDVRLEIEIQDRKQIWKSTYTRNL